MNGIQRVFLWGCVFFSTGVQAFPCYVTLAKDSCWTNYNLTVKIQDTKTHKIISSVLVPEDEHWARAQFECEPKESLMFVASYTPTFWKNSEGLEYRAKRYWMLPETVEGETQAWNMNICFSDDFAAVPLPPDALGNCACDMKSIPPIQPIKN